MKKLATTLSLSALSFSSFAALTPPPDESKPFIDLRYRFENVQDDTGAGTLEDADASTLRLRFGAQTQEFAGFSGKFAFEEVNAVGGDENYNSGTNNNTTFAGTADPTGDSLDEAYLQYRWDELYVRFGRQFIEEAEGRLIGAASWRQSQQTFDAYRISYQGLPNTQIDLIAIDNAVTIRNQDADLEGAYLHATTKVGPGNVRLQYLNLGTKGNDDEDLDTFLIGYKGNLALNEELDLLYFLEFGQQTDGGDNATDITVDYSKFEFGFRQNSLQIKAGMEVLGEDEDSGQSFQTPIALLHGHNGWADVFVANTPNQGLADTYINLAGNYDSGLSWQLVYHTFTPDGDGDYGTELDYLVTYQVNDPWKIGFKYANYMADDNGSSTERFDNDLQSASFFTEVKF